MRNTIIALLVMSAVATNTPLFAQTNSDEVAQLTKRVAELEKQVKEISQFLEPLKGQQSIISNRREALRKKVQDRFAQDRDKFSLEDVIDSENLFHVFSSKPGTAEATNSFEALLKKYPEYNRTGCAVLYLAQRCQGEERIKYLQQCIDKYADSMYGDGVQVGAFARYLLAKEYALTGDDKKAAVLAGEIKAKYPDAVYHGGSLLLDLQGGISK